MKRITALPPEVGAAVDIIVRNRTRGSDERDLIETRAEVVAELISDFYAALTEVGKELRALGLTWSAIAKVLGMSSAGAAERRFSEHLDKRRKQSRAAQSPKTPAGLAGVTVAVAAQTTGLSPTTVHNRIAANLDNPDATWFTRTPAPNKKGYVDRITDLDRLRDAKGMPVKKASRQTVENEG